MYVCLCRGVTESDIQQAVAEGARRMRDLYQRSGVAGQCGGCAGHAQACLRQARTPGGKGN